MIAHSHYKLHHCEYWCEFSKAFGESAWKCSSLILLERKLNLRNAIRSTETKYLGLFKINNRIISCYTDKYVFFSEFIEIDMFGNWIYNIYEIKLLEEHISSRIFYFIREKSESNISFLFYFDAAGRPSEHSTPLCKYLRDPILFRRSSYTRI